MTNSMFGAYDLSQLAPQPTAPATDDTAGAKVGGRWIVDVTAETFEATVALSAHVPVVIDLWASWCEPCKTLGPLLEKLAGEYAGRFQLAKVDVEANQQIAAAFQAKSIPTVVALLGGQPVPLFQGAHPEAQIRQVLDELLKVAASNGISGVLDGEEAEGEPEPPPLPPLHAEAVEAIERGDLGAAKEAYQRAVKQNPRDAEAASAIRQLELIERTQDLDAAAVIETADAAGPTDGEAAMRAADIETVAGLAVQAMERMLAAIGAATGEGRKELVARLVDLFDVIGNKSPEVNEARSRLYTLMY